MRQLPQSEEAEQGLLSSIMQLPGKWLTELGDKLLPEHFYQPRHHVIYSALQRMYDAHKAIDLLTITEFLRDDGQLETVGGAGYITTLYNVVMHSANAEWYLDTVKRKWLRRKIIQTVTELLRASYDETSGDEQALLDQAQAEITSLTLESTKVDVLRHVNEGVSQTLIDLENIYHHRGQQAVLGYETGFIDLDRMTGGIQKKQLVIIGARPSQGKTAVIVNIAAHMSVEKNIPILIFTLEMDFTQICRRLSACVGGLNLQRFRDGFLERDAFDVVPEKLTPLAQAPIWIDQSSDLTIAMFRARARRAKTQYGVKAIFIDYVGLMRSGMKRSARSDDSRWQEVSDISRSLKATAKELDVPVIVCAQLNRETESRTFGRPRMSDLRESGSLEQDADIVALLWRPVKHLDSYKQRNELARGLKLVWRDDERLYTIPGEKVELSEAAIAERDRQLTEYVELQLVKQRDGPTNPVRLQFIGNVMKFHNVTTAAWSNREDERQQNIEED